jgi:hypothetical protein
MCWITQTFPDALAVTQVSTLSPEKLIKWWFEKVVDGIIRFASPVVPWEVKNSRLEITECMAQQDLAHADVLTKMVGDWPSPPAGGARFIHTVRSFLIDSLPALRILDRESWPVLFPEQYHLVKFDRHMVAAQPSPPDPVNTLRWSANPGIGPLITCRPDQITATHLQLLIGRGVGTKALLLEYTRIHPNQGRDLLERVEASYTACRAAFGLVRRAMKMVPPIRDTLRVFGMLPDRPQGWVDLYREEEVKKQRVEKLTERALEQSKILREKSDELKVRGRELKEAAKAVKRKMPEKVDYSCPLVSKLTAMPAEVPPMPEHRLLAIGERLEHRPARKVRLIEEGGSAAVEKKSRPAETVTSGALINSEGAQAAESLVSDWKKDPPALGFSGSGPFGRHTQRDLVTGRVGDWRGPVEPGVMEPMYAAYAVGSSHVLRWVQGLQSSVIHVPITVIEVQEWTTEEIEKAADKLREVDLSGATVYIWMHDDLVYEVAETGDPLYQVYGDPTYHCDGELSVISGSRMKKLWSKSWPIVEACKAAIQLVLVTPLPRYVTAPCCETAGHCKGYHRTENFRRICRKVAELGEATLQWVSRIESDRILVFTPHLEMMQAAKAAREDWEYNLKESFHLDGVHLTRDSYLDLAKLMWNLSTYEPWKLRPPHPYMRSPERVDSQIQSFSFVSASPRAECWDRQEFCFEEFGDRRVFEREDGITVIVSEEDVRMAERGPWANDALQYSGSPVRAEEWGQLREAAYASGYKPQSEPRRYYPG